MQFGIPEVVRRRAGNTQSDSTENIQHEDTLSSQSHDTTYAIMLKEEAQMGWRYNVSVSIANWALLAGYLVIPGTFTSLKESNQVEEALKNNAAGRAVLSTIQNPPLLVIACLFLVGGAAALIVLFRTLENNYSWLVNKIFMPAALNAAAGLLTTLVNVYTSRSAHWSVMAIVTVVVTSLLLFIFSSLFAYYKFIKLGRVILKDEEEQHGEELENQGPSREPVLVLFPADLNGTEHTTDTLSAIKVNPFGSIDGGKSKDKGSMY